MANNAFFKFLQDLVLSGTWRKLTPSARALYPVLAIHTDKDFKPVFPSLKRLKDLSGLGNNGLASALASLEEHGLIRIWSGKHRTGNVPNTYEFAFEYPGSQVSLPPPDDALSPQRGTNKGKKRTRKKITTNEPTTHIAGDVHINITHDSSAAVVDALKQFFSDPLANQLASQYPPDYIQEKIEITRFNHERGKVRDPAAFLRQALSENFGPPPDFTTTAQRVQSAERQTQVQQLMQRILKREITVARHRPSGDASLVDVPADLAYIILQGRHGSRCINSWDDIQHYDFE